MDFRPKGNTSPADLIQSLEVKVLNLSLRADPIKMSNEP